MSEGIVAQPGHSGEALYNILTAALSKRGGMEADDLLCSRNARPPKALVGRAQWKINQPPSLKRQRASLEGSLSRSTRAIENRPGHPEGSKWMKNQSAHECHCATAQKLAPLCLSGNGGGGEI